MKITEEKTRSLQWRNVPSKARIWKKTPVILYNRISAPRGITLRHLAETEIKQQEQRQTKLLFPN